MFPTLLLFVFGVATASTARPTPQNRHHKLPQVISLDCDNTLYRTPTVEKEIVRRLHKYCFKEYNLSPGDADKVRSRPPPSPPSLPPLSLSLSLTLSPLSSMIPMDQPYTAS